MGVQAGTALWMSVWQFLRKLGNNLLEDPVIPLLGVYPKDAQLCHKDMCSTVFIAALFVIARTWKQPKCPSTEELDKENVVHLHNGVLHGRKNDILKFVDKWMDLENIILSEVTQTRKDNYHMYSLIGGF